MEGESGEFKAQPLLFTQLGTPFCVYVTGPASGLAVFAPHKFVAAAVSRKRHYMR
jgi:hypothetical protein